MATFQELFTPLFIILSLGILIGGIVVIMFLDDLFEKSKNRNGVRMFGFAIVINIIILLFLIMSFSKVKFQEGSRGPRGNKGDKGFTGKDGSLQNCGSRNISVAEARAKSREANYLDTKPPLIEDD
jgi:hypothetical protein